ncbi:MAG: GAF domain-containing protein [Bacteroidales bacterium]
MTPLQQLETIIELAAVLSRQSDFQEILRLVTQRAKALYGAQSALIMMVNPTTGETIKTVYRQGDPGGDRQYQLLHTYLTGWVIEHNKGFFTADIGNDSRFRTDLFSDLPVRSVVCSPFRGEGSIIGSLLILSPSEAKSGEEDRHGP